MIKGEYWVCTWDFNDVKEVVRRYGNKQRVCRIQRVNKEKLKRARYIARSWGVRVEVDEDHVEFGPFDSFEGAMLFAFSFDTWNISRRL